jgi:hypothetical protein
MTEICVKENIHVKFQVFTAVTMRSSIMFGITDVPEEYIASIFRFEVYAKQETNMEQAEKLLETEAGRDMFLRNVG